MQNNSEYREELNRILNDLPEEKIAEIVDFASFLRERARQEISSPVVSPSISIPARMLKNLIGAVEWGGDALMDSERIYE